MEPVMNRKRKHDDLDDDDELALSLSLPSSAEPTPLTPLPLHPQPQPSSIDIQNPSLGPAVEQPPPHPQAMRQHARRTRRNPSQGPRGDKTETIEPPFPWATNLRASIYTLQQLLDRGIDKIHGEAQCKQCESRETIVYDLRKKFTELVAFIAERMHAMHDRAPPEWLSPDFPSCRACQQPNCMKPVVASKKKNINWLFMLLGKTLGCCTLDQLKYFCKHTKVVRTGAKDRMLYHTYIVLCKQLDPTGLCDL